MTEQFEKVHEKELFALFKNQISFSITYILYLYKTYVKKLSFFHCSASVMGQLISSFSE